MATSRPAAKEAREGSPEAVAEAVVEAGVAGVAGVAGALASAVPSRRLWRRVARAVCVACGAEQRIVSKRIEWAPLPAKVWRRVRRDAGRTGERGSGGAGRRTGGGEESER
jgi:hypothetical protein